MKHQQALSSSSESQLHNHSTRPPLEIDEIDVTVSRPGSVDRIRQVVQLAQNTSPKSSSTISPVSIGLQDRNGPAAQRADLIILGCKPWAYKEILTDEEVRNGLLNSNRRKTLVSTLGGVTIAELEACLFQIDGQGLHNAVKLDQEVDVEEKCTVIHAVPSVAARIQESMTVLAASPSANSTSVDEAERLFAILGPTKRLPESKLSLAASIASSSVAFYANLISAAASGASGDGSEELLSREEALWISAQAARGTCGLLLAGQDPHDIIDAVATKGGSTRVGLDLMKERRVEEAVMEAIQRCAKATGGLSKTQDK